MRGFGICFFILFLSFLFVLNADQKVSKESLVSPFKVEGRVVHTKRNDRKHIIATLSRSGLQYTALVREDGRFFFHNITSGSFVLTISSPHYVFPSARIDVSGKFPGKLKARSLDSSTELPYPLRFEPLGLKRLFEPREGFDVFGYLKSPMVLVMVATLGLMGCSQAMQSLDPDAAAEVQKQKIESRYLAHAILKD